MSLSIHEHYSLKACNTFGVDVAARWFAEARDEAQARMARWEQAVRQVLAE